MSDLDALDRRLRAVERTLTDGEHDVEALRTAADVDERLDRLESDLADWEERLAEVEAATRALRGYVGNVRAVNEDVRERADAALSAVERLEGDRPEETRDPADDDRTGPNGRRPPGPDAIGRPHEGRGPSTPQGDERSVPDPPARERSAARAEVGETSDCLQGDGPGSASRGGDGSDGGLLTRLRSYV